ncbi:hypothetical protein [Thiovibrio frasassiensis]|uniref:Uncharacterized protein n=1 Tax=Thiovibrio frasassiensis TaxID=2984131 RepID=A0A9X4MCE5_9BACT|nr:hypothetical protein [Thiovibrio frasassiensis]MDG4474974.1 hypothetical protein [Thiovibrio frasassiensis]
MHKSIHRSMARPGRGFTISMAELEKEAAQEKIHLDTPRILLALAAIVGLWGLVNLFSGILQSGGVAELGLEWFNAVLGM